MQHRTIKYVHSDYLIQQADKNPAVKGRASLTHDLIVAYGLLPYLQILCPKICNSADLRNFHSQDYVMQLMHCPPKEQTETEDSFEDESNSESDCTNEEYGLCFDCPKWRGIREYAFAVAGATMTACDDLCKNTTKMMPHVIINWTGGWHHAHRNKAAGYCYINDIVLGILVLRKRFKRILYLDLDVHHGDGVQGAFEITKRVFTLSFHKYECGFYPGTGTAEDCGMASGKGYSANFPYQSGITDVQFQKYFNKITTQILNRYQPEACIIQCGADAIVGDPLGGTNLTPDDISQCVEIILERALPTLILGGGGYNFPNTSRFWTILTAALCGQKLDEDIPDDTPQFLDYGPGYSLPIKSEKFLNNSNTDAYLEKCSQIIEDNLEKYNVDAI